MSSSSSSPCAACKLLRRKCTPGCIFAPYFPPEQPEKFASVHRVFGASNVGKLLKEIVPERREEAVASLAYEAAARLQDPVHGCVGYICLLQRHLGEIQRSLAEARKELAVFLGPAAAFAPSPFLPHHHLHHHHHYHLQHRPLPPAVVPFAEMQPNANAAAGGFVQHHHHPFDDCMMAGGEAGPPQLVAFPGSDQIEFPYGIEQLRVREGVN
ncbi:LOB domain-containing protein 25-like [Zingiber officinale]|uniref:LOB domain-containing protein 25-like n=1 Tax=Zingiber officinale TaxID=94328 RepID=UPI001C4C4BD0|nr:LOB domain-containing protein 25-like [Zingiber officinale]